MTLNGNVTNRGTVEANTLNVNTNYYDNQVGVTQSVGNMTFAMGGGTLQNTGGNIFAGSNLTINAGLVVNDQTAPTGASVTSAPVAVSDPSVLLSGVVGTEKWSETEVIGNSSGADDYTLLTGSGNLTMLMLLSKSGAYNGTPVVDSGVVYFNEYHEVTGASTSYYTGQTSSYGSVWNVSATSDPNALASVAIALPTVYQTTTTQAQGTSGVISAGGSISLTANTLSNLGGQITAQGNIALNLQSLSNGVAAPSLSTVVTQSVDQGQYSAFISQLASLGLVGASPADKPGKTVCIEGGFCDPGAANLYTFNAGDAAPSATGTTTTSGSTGMIAAGNNLSVSGGSLVNAGVMYGAANVYINAVSLVNQGSNSSQNGFGFNQSDATIFAGNDLVVAAGNVSNTYGNLIAGHDVVIGGLGTTSTSSTPAQSLTNTSGNIIAGNDITLNVSGAITNTLPPPTLVYQNYGSTQQYSGCMTAGGYKNGYCAAYVEQQSGSSSTISAGNSLTINAGTLTNIGSLITAGTSATINVTGPIVNSAQTLNAYWHSHWTQETGLFSSDKTHDIWACGSAAECEQIYGSAYTGGSIDPPTPIGNVAATIQAPNLTISSGGQIQNVGNIIGTQVSLTGQSLINGITTANTYTPTVGSPSQVISISPLTMPGLNISVPRSGALPTSTNGQVVYVDGQLAGTDIGPQQLLNNLPANLRPSSDVFYYNPEEEDAMLQQASLQQTGQASFINGLTYDDQSNMSVTEQEKAVLYQNAVNYATTNDLQIGTALTQTQINQLTQPMLWYVEQTVPDPQCTSTGVASCPTITALMPQVYLPANYTALSAEGNIEGTNVTLNFGQGSGGSVLNTGNITASNTLTVNTDSLTNEANQVNVGNEWNSVKGGYTDTTGTVVQPGGFMSAENLDLNVQTLAQIGGALQELNADGTVNSAGTAQLIASLQQQLGGDFTQTSETNDLNTSFVKEGGSFGALQLIAMIAAIAVSIVTAGAASAAIGLELSALSTTFAAGAVGNMALSAAIAGLASNVTSQLITTGGVNWGSAFGSAAVSAITAGLTNGITYNTDTGALGFTTSALPAGGSVSTLASLAGVQNVAGSLVPQAGAAATSSLPTELAAIGGEALIQAGAKTAIDGGSFLNALENSATSDLAASGAFAIGQADANGVFGSGPLEELEYVAAHGALGCAASAAEGTGCAGGAIGGATSALVTPLLRDGLYDGSQTVTYANNGDGTVTQTTTYDNSAFNAISAGIATLSGGVAAGLAGANVQAGAVWAENEALNNSLSPKYQRLTAQTQACSGQSLSCYQNALAATQTAYQQAQQDVAANCGSGGDATACQTARNDMAQLYVNGHSLQQFIQNTPNCTTVVCVALTTGGTDLVGLGVGALLGKVVSTVRGAFGSSTGSATGQASASSSVPTAGDVDLNNVYGNQVQSSSTSGEPVSFSLPNGTTIEGVAANPALAPAAPTQRYLVTPAQAAEYLQQMGIPQSQIDSFVSSFQGPIYIRNALPGETFGAYSGGSENPASGQFLTPGTAGQVPGQVTNTLALPPNNPATTLNAATINKPIPVLEGVVGPQNWNGAQTGGGWQVFVPGGARYGLNPPVTIGPKLN